MLKSWHGVCVIGDGILNNFAISHLGWGGRGGGGGRTTKMSG